ncbi:MAG TPA: hypothetical protein PLG34_06670 [Spirochaetota bacterium]|jgi:light-regulated signal transduction histidine kinase (bacteriophytochrome)|nr:MAG: aerobic respiration control sensor protein ArcB [Spirochaetes bacterium ADurb.Bin133]HNZ27125.1 hypothetical protein [Spirochaetota bacterium]HPY87647.1 hypothetical protein [Spirochaetota bacterium]
MGDKSKYDELFGKAMPQLIHDIRNPLNIIIGFSSIIQIDETVNDEVRGYLRNIFHSGMFIEEMLSNIDYFSMEKIDLDESEFEVTQAIQNFFKTKNETITDKKISLNIFSENEITVRHSLEILNKILENLFQFSLKGFKSISSKDIFISIKKENNNLLLRYSDSSEPVHIKGDYFSVDETIKIRRGLGPIFVEKFVEIFNGNTKYYYLKDWYEINKDARIKTNHGFCISLPIALD